MTIVAALLFLFAVQSDEPKAPPPGMVIESRNHFEIRGKDGERLYEGTAIVRLRDETSESFLLVRDEGHGDFVIRKVWDFRTQIVQHRMSDVKDRAFFQLTYKMPFTARTRLETLEEGRKNPILVEGKALLSLETNGGVWGGSEAEWEDAAALRALRRNLRSTIDRFILESLERARGLLFATSEGSGFFLIAGRYAVYDTDKSEQDAVSDTVETQPLFPNCDFDDTFGFPCSEKQKEALKKAAESGEIPSHY